ncbi:MAG: hypothetical protein ACQEQG_00525 [Bacillota bacterium]
MKDTLHIKDEKAMDLISDPFTMDILVTIENHIFTKESIAEELDEKQALISHYIEEMVKVGLLDEVEGGYQVAAKNIDAQAFLINADPEVVNLWISGFLNHLENNLNEKINRIAKLKETDKEKAEDQVKRFRLSHSQLYLTKNEVTEFHKMLNDFISEKNNQNRAGCNSDCQKYHFYNFFYPTLKK